MSDNLQWLQNFYASLCDGLWEHGYGCNLDTLDNPGWKFIFELNGTPFEKASGLDVRLGEHVDVEGPDWIILPLCASVFASTVWPSYARVHLWDPTLAYR